MQRRIKLDINDTACEWLVQKVVSNVYSMHAVAFIVCLEVLFRHTALACLAGLSSHPPPQAHTPTRHMAWDLALAELAGEANALHANVDGLHTFNEVFASWMYVMNMHALTVERLEVRGILFPSFLSGCE